MPRLIAMILRSLLGKLGLLLVILALLLAGAWLKSEWEQHRAARGVLEQQEAVLDGLRADLQSLEVAIAADQAEWRRETAVRMRALWEELDALNDRIAAFERQSQAARGEYLDLAREAQAARRAANQAEAKLDALERNYWWWDSYVSPAKLVELQAARASHAALDRTARALESARARSSQAAASIRREIATLQARQKVLLHTIEDPAHSQSPRHASLAATRDRKQQEIDAFDAVLDTERARVESNPRERLIATIKSRIPLALGILAGILLLPVAIKALFYYVLAPLAGRLGPIRILPDAGPPRSAPPPAVPPARSAVSATVDIPPGEELLVQPDFLQSSSQPARKRTRWFLNPRLPFASLASGMFALTSVQPEGETPTRVVVSSQRDPFSEIGVVTLPAGAAMVIHPRSLAGVVKPADGAARITRHWRLGSLHAWLTLQLRYLVFHGPTTLLLRGCRGVRAEAPLPDQPRLINQAATLGFSANLEYRTVRCETFVPYLRGHEALFNDLFAGGPGWFVYEEMPAREGRGGVTGRGLDGLTDAVLKVFGI
jgi:hypothetical protein